MRTDAWYNHDSKGVRGMAETKCIHFPVTAMQNVAVQTVLDVVVPGSQ